MSPAKARRRKLRRARQAWGKALARVDAFDVFAALVGLTPAARAAQAEALDRLDRARVVLDLVVAAP